MDSVKIWEEQIVLPTYEIGEADKNPMFLEGRVYQGSSGKVYPYPTVETVSDVKTDKEYRAVWLENEYLKVMILPELGGRIQRAYDKTNDYDFVYYNHVIKPALVGLCGPWISGGIEFNWPQHHRPTTYSPVDYLLIENPDGSKTCRVSDVDQMYGTRGEASFTLYPGRAYIEIRGQLYNPTPLPQTFLWWANPAVPVNENTQSIFPPDVHAVMDHGKRDVSRFPIATGEYYKHDYSAGVDISRYKNIPVPTSYMAEKSEFDFVGGYDYGRQAGILHVADHHISPGKKQWTWGCGDFGKAWDRNLTDEDGPYVELMTGVYTDNQPDFTWLKPFEEKTFTQYFMPYKAVGAVKNATIDAAVNLETGPESVTLTAYASGDYPHARVRLTYGDTVLLDEEAVLSPVQTYQKTVHCAVEDETRLTVKVLDGARELVNYTPLKQEIPKPPDPAQAARDPEELMTCEELYLTGLHIEQYRHATYRPDPYYLEGLKRDPGDIRLNNAYGLLLLRRGQFARAEGHFRKALERCTWKNPNSYNSEPYYNLGLALFYQDKLDEAFDAFYKATWSSEQQEMGFYYLGCIEAERKNFADALALTEKGLVKNWHNVKARGLKAYLLRKLGREEQAQTWIGESLAIDPFDYLSRLELVRLGGEEKEDVTALARDFHETWLRVARDYAQFGAYEEAVDTLELCEKPCPMLYYYKAYYQEKLGLDGGPALAQAESCPADYCFPNKLEDLVVLEYAKEHFAAPAKACYYLGCLLYDKLQYDAAVENWERSARLDPQFPTVWRNLSLAYYNKRHDGQAAREAMERAWALAPTDARVFLELDQLYKKLEMPVEERLAREAMAAGRWEQAEDYLSRTVSYPENLGEGKLEGAKDNHVNYYLGLVKERLGDQSEAKACFQRAAVGTDEPAGMMYYNDQPADMIYYQGLALEKLGRPVEAKARFNKLLDYGERHMFDHMRVSYFAVSLPDFLIFDDDLDKRNRAHCHYLIGLARLGMGQTKEAGRSFEAAIREEPSHQNTIRYQAVCGG